MPRTWCTERLLLRQLGPEAAAIVRDYGLRSREYHAPWDPLRPPDYWELPVVADRLVLQLWEAEQDRSLCTYIFAREAPEVILGVANLRNITRGIQQACVIGYGLAPEAVGHGFMSEAVDRLVRVAFEESGLHRVEVAIMPRNARSLRVAQRCGFEPEGIAQRYLKIAGRWEDHLRFSRIAASDTARIVP